MAVFFKNSPNPVLRRSPFQAGAGVGYDVGAGVTVSLGYRLYGTTEAVLPWNAKDTGTDEVLKASVLLHNIDLGISYRF